MDQQYWLRRRRASLASARKAISAEARLIYLDLAGRYSIRAANCDDSQDRSGEDLASEPGTRH